ncbi:LSU ribosomal protein L23p (L23Ae) [hydrothermal vent metagenome]|uniref:LSU ribosomal protein L23p (L23Ae) n=1 Tax=hydrothermal vent metagenome TaxID=652676 RepID=A0A3B1CK62_9ZZZZ
MKSPFDIIRRPVITEKATDAKEKLNKITFAIDARSNKIEVKTAVEEAFKVSVAKVNIINVTGKEKRIGRHVGKRPDWKKAIVTLKKGDNIEVFDQV